MTNTQKFSIDFHTINTAAKSALPSLLLLCLGWSLRPLSVPVNYDNDPSISAHYSFKHITNFAVLPHAAKENLRWQYQIIERFQNAKFGK